MAEQPRDGSVPVTFGPPDDPRKWVRCANIIAERLHDGTYPAGEWMPAMARIGIELGASARPVKEAFEELRAKGLIAYADGPGFYYAGNGSQPRKQRSNQTHYSRAPHSGPERQPGGGPSDLLEQKFITVQEFASMFRMGESTVRRLIENDDIKRAIKIGRSYRIPEASVEAYLRTCGFVPEARNGCRMTEFGAVWVHVVRQVHAEIPETENIRFTRHDGTAVLVNYVTLDLSEPGEVERLEAYGHTEDGEQIRDVWLEGVDPYPQDLAPPHPGAYRYGPGCK
jgi:excisionase family DNA binding protein